MILPSFSCTFSVRPKDQTQPGGPASSTEIRLPVVQEAQ